MAKKAGKKGVAVVPDLPDQVPRGRGRPRSTVRLAAAQDAAPDDQSGSIDQDEPTPTPTAPAPTVPAPTTPAPTAPANPDLVVTAPQDVPGQLGPVRTHASSRTRSSSRTPCLVTRAVQKLTSGRSSSRSSRSSQPRSTTDVSRETSSDAPTRCARAPTRKAKAKMVPPPPPAKKIMPSADLEEDVAYDEGDLSIFYEEGDSMQVEEIAANVGKYMFGPHCISLIIHKFI